jgi:ankyrin repeat protein
MWAIADQQPQIAKLLVEHGADVHARSKGGFTPLLFAVQQGDVQSAGILLNAGADKNEFDTKDHMSAVMVAASMDHPEVAALLLDKGADPNLLDVRGYTALHFAASSANRLEIVKALLAHDAKPNVRTTRNLPEAGFGGISFKGATPLFVAASVGNIQAVRALVSAGADPQIPTDLKTTPVAAAAGLGSPQSARDYTDEEKNNLFETTKFLVSLGADVNAAGEHGWTPLHGAAYKGIDQVVQFLMEHGANANVFDEYGQTPLSIASAIITEGSKDHYDQSARIFRQSTRDLLLKMGAKPLEQSGVQIVGTFSQENNPEK